METVKFKTNIKCEGCVAKVTPGLDEMAGKGNWKVDLLDPQRTLTLDSKVDETKLKEALAKVGYKAEKV